MAQDNNVQNKNPNQNDTKEKQNKIKTSADYFKLIYAPKHNNIQPSNMTPKQKKAFKQAWDAYAEKHGLKASNGMSFSADGAFKETTGGARMLGHMFSGGLKVMHDQHIKDEKSKLHDSDSKPLTGHEYDDYIKASNQESDNSKVQKLMSMIQQYNKCKDPRKVATYAKQIDDYAAKSNDPKVLAVHDKMAAKAARAASSNTEWGKTHIGVVMANMDIAKGPIRKIARGMAHNADAKDEDYVNKATMNPFWSKKLHKPVVNLDAKHRADIDSKSPYAGKHIMTYVSKDGQMIHTQVISGSDFNKIRALNHQKPFSMKDFMHHMEHHIPLATAASNLAFRAKTFVHKGLRKVRGKATHFIQTASIKATRRKFRWQREVQAEQQAHMTRDRQRRLMLAKGAKRPYDAFDIVSPRELHRMLGDDPKNYTFKQDYVNAKSSQSAFNRNTPHMMDIKYHPSWRKILSHKDLDTYRCIVHPDAQQSSDHNPKKNKQAQDEGPDL